MNSPTQQGSRALFDQATEDIAASLFKAYPQYTYAQVLSAVKAAVLSQSYLRSEVVLNNSNNTFQFPILTNENNNVGTGARPTEFRLNLQDVFYVGGWMLYTSKVATLTSTNMLLDTFPNVNTYTACATAGGAFPASSLYTLYNGKLTLTVNERTLITGYPTSNFLQVPQTQLTGVTGSATVAAPISQFDGTALAFQEPNPVLIGSKKNRLNLVLPSNIASAEAGLEETPVIGVLQMWGVLAQNITIVN